MNEITYRQIIDHFGIEHQCRQAMEECGELIQAINKAVRFPDDPITHLQLMEEIADVKIMILQLEEMFDINWKDEMMMVDFKRSRLFRRYQERLEKEERAERFRKEFCKL